MYKKIYKLLIVFLLLLKGMAVSQAQGLSNFLDVSVTAGVINQWASDGLPIEEKELNAAQLPLFSLLKSGQQLQAALMWRVEGKPLELGMQWGLQQYEPWHYTELNYFGGTEVKAYTFSPVISYTMPLIQGRLYKGISLFGSLSPQVHYMNISHIKEFSLRSNNTSPGGATVSGKYYTPPVKELKQFKVGANVEAGLKVDVSPFFGLKLNAGMQWVSVRNLPYAEDSFMSWYAGGGLYVRLLKTKQYYY
jgi:hypothetical protein